MKYFLTGMALCAAAFIGGWEGFATAVILGILEISLSFDNAVVNATVLRQMSPIWQQRFLTWGIAIAVFGMRLIFPIAIVSLAALLSPIEVLKMALHNPDLYKEELLSCHRQIASFGGAFLFMVFMNFFCDKERTVFWFPWEKWFSTIGIFAATGVIAFIIELTANISLVGYGIGISTWMIIKIFAGKFGSKEVINLGISSFIYLEVLDASFSLDGVIGAFALSKDIFIIMLGLGIGAIFIRSMTINMVKKGTLEKYIYLEHGAHYGIGALSLLMFLSLKFEINNLLIGAISAAFIIASLFWSKFKALTKLN